MNKNTCFIISTLAEYQTTFWVEVCLSLLKQGAHVAVLSFDDRSCELLDKHNITNYNIPKIAKQHNLPKDPQAVQDVFQQFAIDNPNFWQSHEKLTFKQYNEDDLSHRFAGYLVAANATLSDLKASFNTPILIQELGGFISVLACMFAAQQHDINNYYLEPAFFKGRLFNLKNTICAPVVPSDYNENVSEDVLNYINNAINQQQIVVPDKDKHHYSSAVKKIINFKNIKRLFQKVTDRHILKKHQEFGYNWLYAAQHVRMYFNAKKLRRTYVKPDACGKFIYFPFHVPKDVAITLRSPEYYDQLAIVDYLARICPYGYTIAVKEHPAMVGALDAKRLKGLLKQYHNLQLIAPHVNNYEVMNKAESIVTINSKTGAEAAMLGKPVYVMGDAFYQNSPLATTVDRLADLPRLIESSPNPPSDDMRKAYFQSVWDMTQPGELYVNKPENIEHIVDLIQSIPE